MRCLPALVLFVLAHPVAAQPEWLWPAEGTPEPVTTSVSTAYLASIGATVGLIGGGMLIAHVSGYSPDDDLTVPQKIGLGMIGAGAMMGPSAGNVLLLGRFDPSAARGAALRASGLAAGMGVAAVGFTVCLATNQTTAYGRECTGPFYAAAFVAGGAAVAGTAYDLAVIPHNAARAREAVGARPAAPRPVTLAPAGRGLALRVPL